MLRARFELASPIERQILSLMCIPFHHRSLSRDSWIRTSDPSLPKRVLYRTEPYPERAPGQSRTDDRSLTRRVLWPLSYGGNNIFVSMGYVVHCELDYNNLFLFVTLNHPC